MKTLLGILLSAIFCSGGASAWGEKAFESHLSDKTYHSVLVSKVLSTDRFVLESGEKIKMIGVNAPEPPPREKAKFDSFGFPIRNEKMEEPIAERALTYTKEVLLGKRVRLEFDVERKSPDFETYAYVFLADGTFVNEEILKQGFAQLKTAPPNNKYTSKLREAYQEARREKRGLQGE